MCTIKYIFLHIDVINNVLAVEMKSFVDYSQDLKERYTVRYLMEQPPAELTYHSLTLLKVLELEVTLLPSHYIHHWNQTQPISTMSPLMVEVWMSG